jgi:hypothetical protein
MDGRHPGSQECLGKHPQSREKVNVSQDKITYKKSSLRFFAFSAVESHFCL